MAKRTVRFVVEFNIHDGKFDAFDAIAKEMIAGTEKEPGSLAYDWCLSADRRRCRLLETFADEAATVAHANSAVVTQLVPKLLENSSITRFEVYGEPGPEARAILAGLGAEIFDLWRGLAR